MSEVGKFDQFIKDMREEFRKMLEGQTTSSITAKLKEDISDFSTWAFEHCHSDFEEETVIENLTEVFREFMEDQRSKKEKTA